MREFLSSLLLLALASLPITEAPSLVVAVLDEETPKPISGALVALEEPIEAQATSGGDGCVTLEGLPENATCRGFVFHHFYQTRGFEAKIEDETVAIEVLLLRTRGSVELQIIDAILGKPIPNATIALYGPVDGIGGHVPSLHTAKADDQGLASLEIRAGAYRVNVTAEDYYPLESTRILYGEERASFALVSKQMPVYVDPLFVASIGWLLGLANYYGGWLLVSLPLGHSGVKRLGWTVVEDGAIYSFFMAIYGTIFLAVHMIWQLLHGVGSTSWDAYSELFTFCTSNLELAVGAAALFILPLGAMGWGPAGLMTWLASALSGILSPVISSLVWVAQFNAFLTVFSAFVLTSWPALLSIGALLYGIPARIARYAGAGLMAFALVYYIGLPLMPLLAGLLIGAISPSIDEIMSALLAFYPIPAGIADLLKTVAMLLSRFYLGAFIFPILYLLMLAALTSSFAYALGGRPIFRVPIVTRW